MMFPTALTTDLGAAAILDHVGARRTVQAKAVVFDKVVSSSQIP